jgi:integrase
MPAWRRKPDGRPYADIQINGHRRKISLLKQSHIDTGNLAPPDPECQALYDAFLRDILPQLEAAISQPLNPEPETRNPTLQSLADYYCATVMPARGNRAATISQNRVVFARWLQFCHEHGVKTLADFRRHLSVIDAYAADRLRIVRAMTVVKELGKVKAAFTAARAAGVDIPAITWPRPKRPDTIYPDPIDPAAIRRLLDHLRTNTRTSGGPGQSSLYNIILFIACVGCRPSDACVLTWSRVRELDTDHPSCLITQQKTGRLIPVALSRAAAEVLRNERQQFQTARSKTDIVFLGRHATQLDPQTLYTALRWHCDKLGLTRITPRSFRQTVTSILYDAGADDDLVKRVTGHQSDAIRAYRRIRRGAPHEAAQQIADILLGIEAYPHTLPKTH